jgi:hypothetical protein
VPFGRFFSAFNLSLLTPTPHPSSIASSCTPFSSYLYCRAYSIPKREFTDVTIRACVRHPLHILNHVHNIVFRNVTSAPARTVVHHMSISLTAAFEVLTRRNSCVNA